jgi:hypothetical protein
MTDTMTTAQTLAAATHPAIGVLCRDGQPVFYAMLDNRESSRHGIGPDFVMAQHRDIAEVLAFLK